MKLYHGSTEIIQHPALEKGRKNNDYGKGFYCTESIELAKEWACQRNSNVQQEAKTYLLKHYNIDCSLYDRNPNCPKITKGI